MASRTAIVNDRGVKDRYPLQFRFWLNAANDDELMLADEISCLKSMRQFTPTIRDAIRLILDLRQGRTDVLFKLFPLLRQQLAAPLPAPAAQPPRRTESPVSMPDFEIEIKQDKNAGKKATANFLRSMDALNPLQPVEKKNESRQIQGANVTFDAPEMDDIDLLEIVA